MATNIICARCRKTIRRVDEAVRRSDGEYVCRIRCEPSVARQALATLKETDHG